MWSSTSASVFSPSKDARPTKDGRVDSASLSITDVNRKERVCVKESMDDLRGGLAKCWAGLASKTLGKYGMRRWKDHY